MAEVEIPYLLESEDITVLGFFHCVIYCQSPYLGDQNPTHEVQC